MKTHLLQPKIIPVKALLGLGNLSIPVYQRPYKWTTRNVNQLIDDVLLHADKSAYRLGTVVMHKDQKDGTEVLNIVDGQQRTITLQLLAHALREQLPTTKKYANFHLPTWSFDSAITQTNIKANYNEVLRRVSDFDEQTAYFFFHKCEVVQVLLTDVSEAFQFFDSQNARGKDLEPHDLLKAYHLREMQGVATEEEKLKCVAAWEAMTTAELSMLFGQYLYRIRNWSKGRSARYFTKNDVNVFKGINPYSNVRLPYGQLHRIAHHYTNEYNSSYERKIEGTIANYPFQADQVIVNGRRFFEMAAYYMELIKRVRRLNGTKHDVWLGLPDDCLAHRILSALSSYNGSGRDGDKYVRNLFDCCLIYYIDKFGITEIGKAIEKAFVWAYTLRLRMYAVHVASVDNHALNGSPAMFKHLREALHPSDITHLRLSNLEAAESTKTDDLKALFTEMKYYHGQS
jgi:hypothetical protein